MENAILATVSDVIETKSNNPNYRNLIFECSVVESDTEFRIDTYNVKCVPIEVATQYSKALKAGKVCKSYTTVR